MFFAMSPRRRSRRRIERHEPLVGWLYDKLENNGFLVRKKLRFVPNNELVFREAVLYGEINSYLRIGLGGGEESKIEPDIIGCLRKRNRPRPEFSIAVELSLTSDLKEEVQVLRQIPAKWKIVVTKDIKGELDGIHVREISEFEEEVKRIKRAT